LLSTHITNPIPNQQTITETHPTHYATQSKLPFTTKDTPSTSIIQSIDLDDKVLSEEETIDRRPTIPRPIRNREKPRRFTEFI